MTLTFAHNRSPSEPMDRGLGKGRRRSLGSGVVLRRRSLGSGWAHGLGFDECTTGVGRSVEECGASITKPRIL